MDETVTIKLPTRLAEQLLDALFIADLVRGVERNRQATGAVPYNAFAAERAEHQRTKARLRALEREALR